MDGERETEAVLPLSEAPAGREFLVRQLTAGHRLRAHLAGMGLMAGVTLRVEQNRGRGPLLLSIRGNRLVLGRGMAAQIGVVTAQGPA